LWLGKRFLGKLRAALKNRQLFSALTTRLRTHSPEPVDNEQFEVVRQRFAAAMGVMKAMRPSARPGIITRLFGGRQYVYQLPWYIFIGPPGSGKTTALLNSGLRFPLADRLGTDPIRGIGGTRNCDWWFTDQAVMIDTAGRY